MQQDDGSLALGDTRDDAASLPRTPRWGAAAFLLTEATTKSLRWKLRRQLTLKYPVQYTAISTTTDEDEHPPV